jgi:hypothetical protein
MTAPEQLELAKKHFAKVEKARQQGEVDDLWLYGFYCLENAATAAATHAGMSLKRTHPAKAMAARDLAQKFGLPDVENLLKDLNDARKAEAYGDIQAPDLDGDEVASEIKAYIDSVENFLKSAVP